jgi:hypothetical protein
MEVKTMLTETKGTGKVELEKKTLSDLRMIEDDRRKKTEFRMQIFDSYVYIDEVKKSDEVYLFQTKMEL